MTLSILLLVCAGLCSVIVGVAVGHVERRGYSLVRYQLLNCAVCVAVAVAGWAAAPSAMYPPSGCPPATWALVLAGTLLCGVFQYLMILMMGRAMKRGPNAIVWAIIQSGLIYPFLMGWLVFGSSMGPRRLAGIALILASVFLYASGKSRSAAASNETDARKQPARRGGRAAARDWRRTAGGCGMIGGHANGLAFSRGARRAFLDRRTRRLSPPRTEPPHGPLLSRRGA